MHNRIKSYAAVNTSSGGVGGPNEVSDLISSPRGAIGSFSGMIGSPNNAGGVASSQGAGGAGLQGPGGQQRFQNLNIMSRRKSGAASGGVVNGNASQN